MVEGYVGPDRRGAQARGPVRVGSAIVLGGVVTVLAIAAAVRVAADTAVDGALTAALTDVDAATVVASVLLAGVLQQLHRSTGRTDLRWAVLGAAGITVAAVADLWRAADPLLASAAAISTGSTAAALGALGAACLVAEVDDRRRAWRDVAVWLGAVAVASGAARGIIALSGGPAGAVGWHLGLATLGVLVAAAVWRRSARGRRRVGAWVGLLVVTLAASEVANALWYVHAETWRFSGAALRLVACLVATAGGFAVLREIHGQQREALHTSETRHRTSEAALRAEREERAHEARNALTAIEAATLTLERHRDRLSEDQRRMLLGGVSHEIARLQRLVADAPDATVGTVDLATVVEHQVALAGSRDEVVRVAPTGTPSLVVAEATEVHEVVQNLLVNAARHAGSTHGAEVVLEPDPVGRRVLLRVEDRGPGVPDELRERIFERAWRADPSVPGSGLGLTVSRALARNRGGDLWVAPRVGGGASFVLALPAAPVAVGERGAHD